MTPGPRLIVREPRELERAWIAEKLQGWWGSTLIVSASGSWESTRLPALVAAGEDDLAGVATFEMSETAVHLITLNAVEAGGGAGSALLAGVASQAKAAGCTRLWLTTTNDNIDALRFYQRRGLRITAVHRGAVDAARAIKPTIPLIGDYGISIRDELELELRLGSDAEVSLLRRPWG